MNLLITLPKDTVFISVEKSDEPKSTTYVTTERMDILHMRSLSLRIKAKLFGNEIGALQVGDDYFFIGTYTDYTNNEQLRVYIPIKISVDNVATLYDGTEWKESISRGTI